ncbi:hypothetical protein Moror_10684 [Moniliophthora roreri MCA 2997]|uniref:Uncharacterized protein n=1 Tax=Moniliophthora roreri (strain MCA 2997) TaxID=1381753 RepID=V2WXS7_MONRO|nr:hypothetical protein Moror_10684 [Moniliophthora roreri MCA 2997]
MRVGSFVSYPQYRTMICSERAVFQTSSVVDNSVRNHHVLHQSSLLVYLAEGLKESITIKVDSYPSDTINLAFFLSRRRSSTADPQYLRPIHEAKYSRDIPVLTSVLCPSSR